jgi:hypothetical protein
MRYYKVKPESDQTRHTIRFRKGTILIANELYTENEIDKALKSGWISEFFIRKHFDPINLAPKNTYWSFGARYQFNQ